jgi:hypothetical protein
MSARYLVACRCGANFAATLGQAGQDVRCECGQIIAIPLLRELRALPPAAAPATAGTKQARSAVSSAAVSSAAASGSAASNSTVRGRVVFAGLLVTVLATLLGVVLLYARAQIVVEWSHQLQSQADSEVIDQMNADEMFQAWHALHSQGLGEKSPTGFMINRNNRATLGRLATWTLAFASVAAVSTIGFSMATRRSAGS